MLPSLSSIRPCGPECSVFSGYSLIFPVFGLSRPSTLAIWPVYQSEPSLAAKGSCGRDPGVGACQVLIEILAGPGIIQPAGVAPFRETFGKVLSERGDLIRRHSDAVIGHHSHDRAPARGRVAGANAAQ